MDLFFFFFLFFILVLLSRVSEHTIIFRILRNIFPILTFAYVILLIQIVFFFYLDANINSIDIYLSISLTLIRLFLHRFFFLEFFTQTTKAFQLYYTLYKFEHAIFFIYLL
ncbi:hypothetical protein H8356DRAFT_395993 [Neocallimastix lanati (nom. inval.)]|nr:hypothetical protein H8356DRAFT_395993 [Neocallimastix sp. JGI-2020a]